MKIKPECSYIDLMTAIALECKLEDPGIPPYETAEASESFTFLFEQLSDSDWVAFNAFFNSEIRVWWAWKAAQFS